MAPGFSLRKLLNLNSLLVFGLVAIAIKWLGLFGGEAGNEVLVLNLLKERGLVERVYGDGAWETILSDMFHSIGTPGRSGAEKARSFVRRTCGNIEGLEAG